MERKSLLARSLLLGIALVACGAGQDVYAGDTGTPPDKYAVTMTAPCDRIGSMPNNTNVYVYSEFEFLGVRKEDLAFRVKPLSKLSTSALGDLIVDPNAQLEFSDQRVIWMCNGIGQPEVHTLLYLGNPIP